MHVVHVIANNSSVPYFNSFADRQGNYPDIKFTFVALCLERPKMIDEMHLRNCECFWIKFDYNKRKSEMVKVFFKLYFLFLKLKPDVVHTHLFDDSVPGLFAAKLAGIKIRAIHKQDTAFHWYYKPRWVWADRFNNYNATHLIAVGKTTAKFIIEREKADSGKVYLIHSGIDIVACTAQKEEYKQHFIERYNLQNKIVIGTVARLIDWKGYKYIVEAVRLLGDRAKAMKFLFVGTGGMRKELEDLINKYNLNEIIAFTGWVDRNKIPSLFGVMDIYLHPASMEPFGFVVSEAMVNGVPIITTQAGGSADLLEHKKTCYIIEERSAQSIVEGIIWMVENESIRNAMKAKVKKLGIENFDVTNMLDNCIKLYKGELKSFTN